MSEQAAQQGEPAVAGPDGTPGAAEQATQQEIDWQNRYQHLQPEYTRATQENAELRRKSELYEALLSTDDPDTQREIAAELGYQLDDEQTQTSDADEDPFGQYDERLGRVEQSLTQREQEEAQAAYAQQVRAVVDERLDALPDLDKDDQDWVLAYAINALPITDEGLPDIEQAHKVFRDREDARQRAWAQTKRAPRISTDGQSATEAPNLDNRQERQDFIMRRMQDGEQAGY